MNDRTGVHDVFALAFALVAMALPPSLMAQARAQDLVNPQFFEHPWDTLWGVEVDESWRLIWDGHELANHEAIQIIGSCEEPYEFQLGVIDTLQIQENMELFHQRLVETMVSLCVPLPPDWDWSDYGFDDPGDLEYICSHFGLTAADVRNAAEQAILDNPFPSEEDLVVLRLLQNPDGDPDEEAALYLEENIFLEGFFQLFGSGALEPSFDGELPRYLLERTSQEVTSMEEVASATYEVVAGNFYPNATGAGTPKVILAMVQHIVFVDGREAHLFQPAMVYEVSQIGTAKADAQAWAEEETLAAPMGMPLEDSTPVLQEAADQAPADSEDCAGLCRGVANAKRAEARVWYNVECGGALTACLVGIASCAAGCAGVTWWSIWGPAVCALGCGAFFLAAMAAAIALFGAYLTAKLNTINAELMKCFGDRGIYFKVDASGLKSWYPRGGGAHEQSARAADCVLA